MSYSLYLCPKDAQAQPDASVLWQWLTERKLVSETTGLFMGELGSEIFDYINYLGCSPVARHGPSNTLIKIHLFDYTSAMGGTSVETLRYPCCKQRITDPTALIADYSSSPERACPNCSLRFSVNEINWRKSAGFACIFLEIGGIFPKEAQPTDQLLSGLESITLTPWQWFYSKTSQFN